MTTTGARHGVVNGAVNGEGLSRRGDAIETDVPGDPEAFHTLAAYLRDSIGGCVKDLGDEVSIRRTGLAGTWTGDAGETFGARAATLASACDRVYPQVLAGADEIDGLGDTLRSVQARMGELRASAAAGGCPLDGTLILRPVHTAKPGDFGLPNYFTETPDEQAQDAVFAQAIETADSTWYEWYRRINSAAGFITDHAADIVGYLSDLITIGTTQSLRSITSKIMQGEADWLREQIEKNLEHQTYYQRWLAKTGDPTVRYAHDRLSDENILLERAARDAEAAAKNPELPRGLTRGFDTLGALATGVGVYADIKSGESGAQAVVSQGSAAVVGSGAALLAGAGASNLLAPGAGPVATVVVVGGAELLAGTAVGAGVDWAIDAVWPDGDGDAGPSVDEQNGGTLLGYADQVTHPVTHEEHPELEGW